MQAKGVIIFHPSTEKTNGVCAHLFFISFSCLEESSLISKDEEGILMNDLISLSSYGIKCKHQA